MDSRKAKKSAFRVELLEGRLALSGCSAFGQSVSDAAQSQVHGSFGQHQAAFAQADGGLGQFNRAGGSSKTNVGC